MSSNATVVDASDIFELLCLARHQVPEGHHIRPYFASLELASNRCPQRPPFAQLQEAGMKTVKLDEIVRQRDPELKVAVELLASGDVGHAVAHLDRQGWVHECGQREERITAIAREYARAPESTLVVSPDNRSRSEIKETLAKSKPMSRAAMPPRSGRDP